MKTTLAMGLVEKRSSWRLALAMALFSALGIACVRPASAEGGFISAPSRLDMVHDLTRQLLYISSGSQVLRYDLNSRQFLTPYQLDGHLVGMDLSPDGNTLAVADSTYANGQNWIYLVDLQTGTNQKKTFPLSSNEGGTFTVAYGNDGNILVSSAFLGSGGVPLRRYNSGTGTTTIVDPNINQNTMLTPSADGSIIAFAESNSSDGPWGRYRVIDHSLVERSGYANGTSWFNFEIGTSRTGSQFAVPTYGGTFIYDASYSLVKTIGQYAGPQPIGAVYHPLKDTVYFAWAETSEVRAFDTTTLSQIGTFDFKYTFQHTGNGAFQEGRMKIARDGSLLFATVGGGIRYVSLLPTAGDFAVSIPKDSTNYRLDTSGNIVNFAGPVTVTITTPPSYGAATLNPDNSISYTPNAQYTGSDSIVYEATDGTSTDSGTISINVVNFRVTDDHYVRLRNYCCNSSLAVLANDFGFADPVTVTIESAPDKGGSAYVRNSPGPRSGVYIDYYANGGGNTGEYLEKFAYQVTDGVLTGTATVTVRVVDFIAQDDSITTNVDTPVTIRVGANDLGFSYPSTAGIFTSAAHGMVAVNGSPGSPSDVTMTYSPAPAFRGKDTFQYAMDDGNHVGIATVTVDVIDDLDLDGIEDGADNCIDVSNYDQRDSNGDGYGNACDGDLNQDGRVNFADLAMFRQSFGSNVPDADFDGNNIVNFADLAAFRSVFGKPPGPSALHP